MFLIRILTALLLSSATGAFAQRPDGPPPLPNVAQLLGIDAAKAAKVEKILADSRERMRALREETDKQLATVLSAEEISKLRHAMRPPPPPRN